MIFRLAYRNLMRNGWRTLLTVGGIAVAVALMIWTMAYIEGFTNQMVQTATNQQTGQIKIQTEAYKESPATYKYFEFDKSLENRLATNPRVLTYIPSVQLYGLLGTEKRSKVVQLYGVPPKSQAKATRIDRQIVSGKWLPENPTGDEIRQVVLGESLARQLDV